MAGEQRRIVVTPLADEIPLRYQDWVADRRAYTHEKSDGRLGYLHVPDMGELGWGQLVRDLRSVKGSSSTSARTAAATPRRW